MADDDEDLFGSLPDEVLATMPLPLTSKVTHVATQQCGLSDGQGAVQVPLPYLPSKPQVENRPTVQHKRQREWSTCDRCFARTSKSVEPVSINSFCGNTFSCGQELACRSCTQDELRPHPDFASVDPSLMSPSKHTSQARRGVTPSRTPSARILPLALTPSRPQVDRLHTAERLSRTTAEVGLVAEQKAAEGDGDGIVAEWLDVPFHERFMAKAVGAQWNDQRKLWFAPRAVALEPLSRWLPSQRIYLRCPYTQKDAAKEKGARYDPRRQKWFIVPGTDPALFVRWLSTSQLANLRREAALSAPSRGTTGVVPDTPPPNPQLTSPVTASAKHV
jgi:hypothetical protein